MRILFCNHTSAFSGAEAALAALMTSMAARHDLALACPPDGQLEEIARRAGINYFAIPESAPSLALDMRETPRELGDVWGAGRAVRSAARAFRPDLIHANGSRAGLITVAAVDRRIPVVAQVHDNLPLSALGLATRAVLLAGAAAVIVPSLHSRASFGLRRRLLPKVGVVYYGIDPERWTPAGPLASLRSELSLPEDARLIGHVAQISPWKRQHMSVEIVNQLGERIPQLHLMIIGDVAFRSRRFANDAYLRQLELQIQDHGLTERVHLLGHRSDVPAVLRALDLTILPSDREPFGLGALESMSVGTPALVGADSGVSEVVEDQDRRMTVMLNDITEWVRGVEFLLSNPSECAALGQRGTAVAARFTSAAYATNMETRYADWAKNDGSIG